MSKQFNPGTLVHVQLHSHPAGVPSKLTQRYSGLCDVLEVRNPTLTLRKLDTQRVFTASHDAVRAYKLPARAEPDAALSATNDTLDSSFPSSQNSATPPRADALLESQPREAVPQINADASAFISVFDEVCETVAHEAGPEHRMQQQRKRPRQRAFPLCSISTCRDRLRSMCLVYSLHPPHNRVATLVHPPVKKALNRVPTRCTRATF